MKNCMKAGKDLTELKLFLKICMSGFFFCPLSHHLFTRNFLVPAASTEIIHLPNSIKIVLDRSIKQNRRPVNSNARLLLA